MIEIHSKSKKHKFVTKDGNKLSKRKIGDFKESLWFKESTKNLFSNTSIFLIDIPKDDILLSMGKTLKIKNNNLEYIAKKDILTYPDKFYIIVNYNALNKVADILNIEDLNIYNGDDIGMFYNKTIENMRHPMFDIFNHAIEFDYENYLKYRKHYDR